MVTTTTTFIYVSLISKNVKSLINKGMREIILKYITVQQL